MDWLKLAFWTGCAGAVGYVLYKSIGTAQAAIAPQSVQSFTPTPSPAAWLDQMSASGGKVQSVSAAGASAIKAAEGLQLTAYPDAGGYSIGYGHFGASAGQTITQDQADAYFAADLQNVEDAINASVTVALDQSQYDALADLVYNIGITRFKSSTLLSKLNAGDYAGAAAEFDRWKYSGGEVSQVLLSRRETETAEFDG